jgi:hypothetical protein
VILFLAGDWDSDLAPKPWISLKLVFDWQSLPSLAIGLLSDALQNFADVDFA